MLRLAFGFAPPPTVLVVAWSDVKDAIALTFLVGDLGRFYANTDICRKLRRQLINRQDIFVQHV